MKPFSEACEQNKGPILEVLREAFRERRRVLEIGSGTGQHAAFFPAALPHLQWLPSDRAENLEGIHLWVTEARLANVAVPVELDVHGSPWPVAGVDGVFSANTAHIMDEATVAIMFAGVGRLLEGGGTFVLYGPFNYGGQYTSDSNARFDQWLKARDPAMGIKDFEDLDALATGAGMELAGDHAMPANNRSLVWCRRA
ncbi:MAG: DUF938 domain-containing protein [Gammaproteobacteria bacterium]|nr:DUF938 domain-containing protein [Gammaproteobacteria bacterium]